MFPGLEALATQACGRSYDQGRFVVVDGTLKDPRTKIDSDDLLVEGGAAWATGGLSLVAGQIFGRLTASGSPCETVLKQDAPDAGP